MGYIIFTINSQICFNLSLLKAPASTPQKKSTTRGQQNQRVASIRNLSSFDFAGVHDWWRTDMAVDDSYKKKS